MFQNGKALVLGRRYTGWEETSFHLFTSGLGGVEWSPPLLTHFSIGKETQYSLNKELGGSNNQSRSFGEDKSLLMVSGFEPQTIQFFA